MTDAFVYQRNGQNEIIYLLYQDVFTFFDPDGNSDTTDFGE